MRARILLLFVALAFIQWPGSLWSAQPEENKTEHLNDLIIQLGSKSFRERETASQSLSETGPMALDALRRAAQSDDPEIRRRAEHLTQQIQKRIETAQLLEPKKVHLVYKEVPVDLALADFVEKTGFPIEFKGARNRLGERKITLDTGVTTFWDAFDQFCRKAELVEQVAAAPLDQTVRVWNAQGAQVKFAVQMSPTQAVANPGGPDSPLVLVDGQPRSLPTDYVGAVRVRALTVQGVSTPGEVSLSLEASPQPRMAWQTIVDVRIDSAIDDLGQLLKPALAGTSNDADAIVLNGNGVVRLDTRTGLASSASAREAPIRLKLPDKPSKVLKELKGVLAAEVRTPLQPLITVENLAKAVGQSHRGPNGETLKVLESSRQGNGLVKLRIHLQNANSESFLRLNGRVAMNGNVVLPRNAVLLNNLPVDSSDGAPGLCLLDSKGKELALVGRNENLVVSGNTIVQEILLTYRLRDEAAAPERLIYSGRRTAIIEVPFDLKDVRLP